MHVHSDFTIHLYLGGHCPPSPLHSYESRSKTNIHPGRTHSVKQNLHQQQRSRLARAVVEVLDRMLACTKRNGYAYLEQAADLQAMTLSYSRQSLRMKRPMRRELTSDMGSSGPWLKAKGGSGAM